MALAAARCGKIIGYLTRFSGHTAGGRKLTSRVIFSDLDNFVLQPPGLFVLLHVFLSLQPGRRVQHDVLDLVLDVFSPRCQPGHLKSRSRKTFQTVRKLTSIGPRSARKNSTRPSLGFKRTIEDHAPVKLHLLSIIVKFLTLSAGWYYRTQRPTKLDDKAGLMIVIFKLGDRGSVIYNSYEFFSVKIYGSVSFLLEFLRTICP